MERTTAELALIYQALREAASYTRIRERREAYLALARKMREERIREGWERIDTSVESKQ